MAITKNFVEMMGGHIDIESEKGIGSKFTVSVQLGISEKLYRFAEGVQLPSGLRALIVDDDPIACEHAQLVLRSLGIEAASTQDPVQGLKKQEEAFQEGKPYDLVLADFKMPGMDGLSFAKALREFDEGRSILLLVTGYHSDLLDGELTEKHIDGAISKPLFKDSLLHSLLSALEKRGRIASAEPSEGQEEENVLSGLRVLIAEDVDANAEILADLLDLEGIESERAENGQAAVEMFQKADPHSYDAILMDVRMPIKDGLTATAEIRALEREDAASIPIIAMTANVFDEDVERSLAAGMNAHLSKPIEPEKLFAELRRLIGRKKPLC